MIKNNIKIVFFLLCILCISLLSSCNNEADIKEQNSSEDTLVETPTISENGELFFYRDDMKIYGKILLPEGEGPFPLVILSHGYGGNHTQSIKMAEKLSANGVAAYVFDFIGGGNASMSDGATTEMTVLTEAEDLNAIIDGIGLLPEIDSEKIILCGYSQGGMVSSYVATKRPDDIKALVAYFPAYVIHDDAKEMLDNPEGIEDEIDFMGMTISREYFEDAVSFDIFELFPNYKNDVFILHGTKDPIAPIEYSQRAIELFPSARLLTVEGKGHGTLGDEVNEEVLDFVLEHID